MGDHGASSNVLVGGVDAGETIGFTLIFFNATLSCLYFQKSLQTGWLLSENHSVFNFVNRMIHIRFGSSGYKIANQMMSTH